MKSTALTLTYWLLLTLAVQAQTSEKFRADELVTIDAPVEHNLYVAGERVTINAPVRGDVLAAAGTIEVNDSIHGDLTAAGGTVMLNSPVQEDVLVAGGTVQIIEPVGGDVITMGGEVTLAGDNEVGQDVVVFSGEARLDGTVVGNLIVYGGTVQLNGECRGNLEMKGGEITINGSVRGTSALAADRITLGPDARLYGPVRYWTPEETDPPDFASVLVGTTAERDESLYPEDDFPWPWQSVPWFLLALAYVLAVLLIIGFIFWVFPRAMDRAGTVLHQDFVRSFGYGVLYLIGVPLVVGLLMISFIGIPLGLFFLFAYGFALLFGHAIVSVVITYSLRDRYQYDWSKTWMILVAFLVFSVLRTVTLTPLLGIFVSVLMVGACFGALITSLIHKEQPVTA
jgi:hypothetical protein